MPLVHYLLAYDRNEGRLVVQQPFADSAEAVKAYENLERKYGDAKYMEIVLVGADSIESVMLTHGNYFDAVPAASPYLAGV
jgi:hypothetical protein